MGWDGLSQCLVQPSVELEIIKEHIQGCIFVQNVEMEGE
jgi:hypothetical protein